MTLTREEAGQVLAALLMAYPSADLGDLRQQAYLHSLQEPEWLTVEVATRTVKHYHYSDGTFLPRFGEFLAQARAFAGRPEYQPPRKLEAAKASPERVSHELSRARAALRAAAGV